MTSKFDRKILVVKRSVLFKERFFEGFLPIKEHNFMPVILNNYEWLKRGLAEDDLDYKQIIPYAIIVNPNKGVFVFRRASKQSDYSEKRLFDKYALGVGGHIEMEDVTNNKNVVEEAFLRELNEEVFIKNFDYKIVGFVNLEERDVDKVHFGVVFLVKTSDSVSFKQGEMVWSDFLSLDILLKKKQEFNFEGWSLALLEDKNFIDYCVNNL